MAKGVHKKSHQVTFLPFAVSIEVPEGTLILEAARKASLPLPTPCGGEGTCGECVVKITKGNFAAKMTAALSAQLRAEGFALACQTRITGDMMVVLPHFQERIIASDLSADFYKKNKDRISGYYEHSPAVVLSELHVIPPTLANNTSDLRRLEQAFRKNAGIRFVTCSLSVLSKLAQSLRVSEGQVTVVSLQDREEAMILDVSPPRAQDKKIYGLAADLGTTTVAVHLIDLGTGDIVGSATCLNQQIKCGEDIISRINYARKPAQLQEIQNLIIRTLNNLILTTTQQAGIMNEDIYHAVFAGNTTMSHLLLRLDPRHLREEPYVPTFNDLPPVPAKVLGLSMNPEAKISLAPSVGSYVGGDITAGILCTPFLRSSQKIFLFIDAGTNGELVIGNKDWMMTCACSAGPAFEGGGIKCGMPATEGAIEMIDLDEEGKAICKVIGGTDAKGLCGSGLVDLLAELFIHGFVDRSGKFMAENIPGRIVDTDEGQAFCVVEAAKSYWGKDICITERDIANLIRTKGAVFSACALLLKNVGLGFGDIDSIYIAGSFGQHLDVENAIRIGLLPDLPRKKFHYIGNSSLMGATMILLSDRNRRLVLETASRMTYVELNTEPSYMNEYTSSLFLPHTDRSLFPSVDKTVFRQKQRKNVKS